MRKSLLSLAKKCTAAVIGVAGLVGSASAVVTGTNTAVIQGFQPATSLRYSPNNIGHILLVPYFTVNGGNDTYLSINNTDMRNGKAVKVRFRGAGNSDDIFDFTVFLSPGDVWTAAVTKDATSGLSKLVTTDRSCTLPSTVGKGTGTLFITARVPGNAAAATNEGYVEIFNMADVPPTLYNATLPSTTASALFTAIKHVNGTPPCTGSAFNPLNPTTNPAVPFASVTDTTTLYSQMENLGFTNPTTGLKANWTVLNVAKAAAWTGAAEAIEASVTTGGTATYPGYGNIVFYPQTSDSVSAANARLATADPLLRGGIVSMPAATTTGAPGTPPVAAAMYDLPDLSTPYLYADLAVASLGVGTRRQAFNLINALAVSSVSNEFVVDPSILAQTDFVFSLPSRRYNVGRDYAGSGSNVFTNLAYDDGNTIINGQWNFFANENTSVNATQYPNIICVTGISGAAGASGTPTLRLTSGQTGDREEVFLAASSDFVVSPGVPGATFSICGEVAVFSFSAAGQQSVLGASLTRFNVGAPYTAGWARIATPGLATASAATIAAGYGLVGVATGIPANAGVGLPVTGYAVMQITNNNAAPGTVGNYGLTFPHGRTPYAAQ